MKKTAGLSFLSIMITIAFVGLLLRIAVEQLINMNIAQNELNASSNLKLISTALENYSRDNNAVFPAQVAVLTNTNPRYLDEDYIARSPVGGYDYACRVLEPSGYSCFAAPVKCGITGNKVYTVTTGGALLSEDCRKRE